MSSVVSAQLRSFVYQLDLGRCAYCRSPEELTVTRFEIDHIIPRSLGGGATASNLCLACPSCNRHKSARQEAVDPQTGQSAPLFHPRSETWSDHFIWNSEGTQVVGQTPTGRATVLALRMNRPQMVRLRGLWQRLGYYLPD